MHLPATGIVLISKDIMGLTPAPISDMLILTEIMMASDDEYVLPLVTPETWEKYSHSFPGANFLEYVEATVGITKKLESILSEAQSFDELKKELTNFIEDRTVFTNFARDNLP